MCHYVVNARFGHDIELFVSFTDQANFCIRHVRSDCERGVSWQRPGSSRPCQHISHFARVFWIGHAKTHGHRQVCHIRVSIGHFVVRESRLTARTKVHWLVSLVDQTFLIKFLERPPGGLGILGIHGLVVVLHVDPAPGPRNDFFPLVFVHQDLLPALLVELLNTIVQDFFA